MASRLAAKALKSSASLARPRLTATLPRIAAAQSVRGLADTPQQSPAEKANSLISAVPGNSLLTKTGTILIGTGAVATAISQELYVVNEETIVVIGFFIILTYLGKIIQQPYKEWAEGHIDRVKSILDSSRKEHTKAVSERIEAVEKMKDVVDLTKGLFALSKETAQLEADNFVKRQQVHVVSEVKAVLDSWVRYEQQAKENEQAELVKSVIEKVLEDLKDGKSQKEILLNAVTEVEQIVKNKGI